MPNKKVRLVWATNGETHTNLTKFVIERAVAGGTLSKIAEVAPAGGNFTHLYNFDDNYPCYNNSGGNNLWYRIRWLSLNNEECASQVVPVSLAFYGCPSSPSACSITSMEGPTEVCGSSAEFTIVNGVAPVTWSIEPEEGVATLVPHANGYQATLNKEFDGTVTIRADMGSCWAEKTVTFGKPIIEAITFTNGIGEEGFFCTSHIGNEFAVSSPAGELFYNVELLTWPALNVIHTQNVWGGGLLTHYPSPGWYVLQVRTTNSCGTTDWFGYEVEFVDCTMWSALTAQDPFTISASPNPASGFLNISITNEKAAVKKLGRDTDIRINLYDMGSMHMRKQWKFQNRTNSFWLNVSNLKKGRYILQIVKGNYKVAKQIILK